MQSDVLYKLPPPNLIFVVRAPLPIKLCTLSLPHEWQSFGNTGIYFWKCAFTHSLAPIQGPHCKMFTVTIQAQIHFEPTDPVVWSLGFQPMKTQADSKFFESNPTVETNFFIH